MNGLARLPWQTLLYVLRLTKRSLLVRFYKRRDARFIVVKGRHAFKNWHVYVSWFWHYPLFIVCLAR